MARWTVALSAPGAARTLIESYCPTRSNSCWAVGSQKAAMVAPARLLAVPNRTMPEMVKVCGGPASRIRTCSPTVKWYFCAVPASTTTWWASVGRRALDELERRQRGFGSNEVPIVGRPAGGDGLAVGGHELGVARDGPVGVRHAGHGGRWSTSDSGIGLRTAPP